VALNVVKPNAFAAFQYHIEGMVIVRAILFFKRNVISSMHKVWLLLVE
jgi:hypothetical protein